MSGHGSDASRHPSGKSFTGKKEDYLDATGKWKLGTIQLVQEQLTKAMGVWEGKQPCPHFHIRGRGQENAYCRETAQTCRFYH